MEDKRDDFDGFGLRVLLDADQVLVDGSGHVDVGLDVVLELADLSADA